MRAYTHQISVLWRSEPAIGRRQQSDNKSKQHQTKRFLAQRHKRHNDATLALSLSLSLSLSDTIVCNGSDKLNQIHCEMIVGMNML